MSENKELLQLLNTLKEHSKMFNFCKVILRRNGKPKYQLQYLQKIRSGKLNGGEDFNEIIIKHLKEYINKNIEN